MPAIKQVGDLEINQDMDFQEKEWAFERWGWIAMLVIALAALLGLFGQGLLSNTSAANAALTVKYGRFERLLAPAQYEIQIDLQQATDGEVKLQVHRDLLSYYKIERITPQPDSTQVSPEHITYTFKVEPGEQPLDVTFDLQANHLGSPRGQVSLENGPAVNISQMIYP